MCALMSIGPTIYCISYPQPAAAGKCIKPARKEKIYILFAKFQGPEGASLKDSKFPAGPLVCFFYEKKETEAVVLYSRFCPVCA